MGITVSLDGETRMGKPMIGRPMGSAYPGSACPQAAFMARFTAGATHEVRNVLAIVKESAGLVEDLLAVGARGSPDLDRIQTALSRIEAQVARGADLMTSLNHLAHGLDRTEEPVELNGALRHTVHLYRRFAREVRREVEVQEATGTVVVTAGSLAVHMALAAALDWWVERLPEGATALVEVEAGEDPPLVRLRSEDPGAGGDRGDPGPEEWARLTRALAGLPATPEWEGPESGLSLHLG